MTHTTTLAEIHHQVPQISSSRGNSGRRPLRWIFLCWTMLSLAGGELTPLAEATTVLEKLGCFDI
jgi:hypothetical protein